MREDAVHYKEVRMKTILKSLVLSIITVLAFSGCDLFAEKVVAPPTLVSLSTGPGTLYVTVILDNTGTVFPSAHDIYYNTVNDISTAIVSTNHTSTPAALSLPAGTYYVWVIAHGTWGGTTYYSTPTVSTPASIAVM